ncbi:hypothetical protein GCM10010254_44830 [Streptomyces chromofuscus]|nr:hypothetical protein GCM10010254_44830 [Streptomyces chromofuscus]
MWFAYRHRSGRHCRSPSPGSCRSGKYSPATFADRRFPPLTAALRPDPRRLNITPRTTASLAPVTDPLRRDPPPCAGTRPRPAAALPAPPSLAQLAARPGLTALYDWPAPPRPHPVPGTRQAVPPRRALSCRALTPPKPLPPAPSPLAIRPRPSDPRHTAHHTPAEFPARIIDAPQPFRTACRQRMRETIHEAATALWGGVRPWATGMLRRGRS